MPVTLGADAHHLGLLRMRPMAAPIMVVAHLPVRGLCSRVGVCHQVRRQPMEMSTARGSTTCLLCFPANDFII